jgi:hypothetical protein
VLVDNEEVMRIQYDKICGDSHELFSHTMVVKYWVSVDAHGKEIKNSNLTHEETR